jgi:hypothetical protein
LLETRSPSAVIVRDGVRRSRRLATQSRFVAVHWGSTRTKDGDGNGQKVTVSLLDDLDGKAADETVQFALDSVSYEIDLSEKNAKKLRTELQPWVTAARRAGGSRRRRGVRSASASIDRTESAAIREWARKSGHEIATRGRIVVGVGGHQVEHITHALQRGGDDVEVADIEAGIVQFDEHTESLPHRGGRHRVNIIDCIDLIHPQRGFGRLGAGRHPIGCIVGDLFIVTGDAQLGCRAGIERGERVEIAFGDRVYGGGGPTQGCWWRRYRIGSDRRSGNRR